MTRNIFKACLGAAVMAVSVNAAAVTTITGAGSTFAYPMYAKWAEEYKSVGDMQLNFQPIGSAGGIRQIEANTVTFGASDAPLNGAELKKNKLVQFPAIIGGTIPVFNLKDFKPGEIRLTGPMLADIYLGKIQKWNDPQIAKVNPGKKLPDQSITVVHRSDGSGTTFNFTDYLSSVSPDWNKQIGKGKSVEWPAPSSVGGKGNEGVAANVNRIAGSVGYVEYAYVMKNDMKYMLLENKDGNFVTPSADGFAGAAAGADWFSVPGMGISIVNQKGAKTWPITTASFILMHETPKNKANAAETLKFFKWSFEKGQKAALSLDYVPLPASLTKQIEEKVWPNIKVK